MKNLIFKRVGGGITRIISTLLIISVISIMTIDAFAIDTGTTIQYTNREKNNAENFTYSDYTGVCAQLGVQAARSGTATIEKSYGRNSKVTKIAYWIWKNDKLSDTSIQSGISGLRYDVTGALLAEFYTQITVMGYSSWRTSALNIMGFSDSTVNQIKTKYDAFEATLDNITIPDNIDFEVYYCDAGNDQSFILWKFEEHKSGKFKLKKTSAHTLITG